jgi:hypothetical protein
MTIGGFPMAVLARLRNTGRRVTGLTAAPQRRLIFHLQAAGIKNPDHGGLRPGSRRHRSGDVVRQSGIYEVVHDREHREAHEVVMISGAHFPDCETCKEKVSFRLIRTAPYIFQDADFEEET